MFTEAPYLFLLYINIDFIFLELEGPGTDFTLRWSALCVTISIDNYNPGQIDILTGIAHTLHQSINHLLSSALYTEDCIHPILGFCGPQL
jgi:hypothetical protein